MLEVILDDVTPNALAKIERLARIAHKSKLASEPLARNRFLWWLISIGHESVFRHAHATFVVSGISRVCSHQLVRHHAGIDFTQESQRHVEPGGYVMPFSIESTPYARAYEEMMGSAYAFYKELTKAGIPREDARFVLPNATSTTIAITMNFQALRHFFKVRCAPDAQWEIRAMANRMLDLLLPEYGVVFEGIKR